VAGERETKKQMLIYTLLLLPIAVSPYFVGIAGLPYLAGSTVLGVLFVAFAVQVCRDKTDRSAKQMFGFSILYLFLLLSLLIGEQLYGPLIRFG
jgi:heme o synthase